MINTSANSNITSTNVVFVQHYEPAAALIPVTSIRKQLRREQIMLDRWAGMQRQQQPFYGPLSATTWVSRYQMKHSPTHHPEHHPIFISFFHLPRSIASSLFKLHAWQSFCTTSLHGCKDNMFINHFAHTATIISSSAACHQPMPRC